MKDFLKKYKSKILFIILVVFLVYNSICLFKIFGGGKKVCFSDKMEDECYFLKDKYNVYYEAILGEGDSNKGIVRISGADPETFKPLNKYFAKDKKDAFSCSFLENSSFTTGVKCRKIKNVDVNSFENISEYSHYAKDKNNVYFIYDSYNYDDELEQVEETKILKNVDQQTFQIIDNSKCFAKDKNNCFYEDKIVSMFDCGRIEHKNYGEDLGFGFSKDKNENKIYFNGEKTEIDANSFSFLNLYKDNGQKFIKDKNNVYFIYDSYDNESKQIEEIKILKNADPETFKVLDDFFSIDKNNCYHENKIISMSVCERIKNQK